jgi:hypothetical protein
VLPGLWKQYDTGPSIISRHRCVSTFSRPSIAYSYWLFWDVSMWSASIAVLKYVVIVVGKQALILLSSSYSLDPVSILTGISHQITSYIHL